MNLFSGANCQTYRAIITTNQKIVRYKNPRSCRNGWMPLSSIYSRARSAAFRPLDAASFSSPAIFFLVPRDETVLHTLPKTNTRWFRFNPFENYDRQIGSFPQGPENKPSNFIIQPSIFRCLCFFSFREGIFNSHIIILPV